MERQFSTGPVARCPLQLVVSILFCSALLADLKWWYNTDSHPEVVETLTEQGANLDHLLSIMISEPVIELAKSLTSLLPAPLDKAIFLNTGSEFWKILSISSVQLTMLLF